MKPANIMVTKDAQGKLLVKILDFGVSKLLVQGETFKTKTQTGEMLGTLLYMSPEQCLRRPVFGRTLRCLFAGVRTCRALMPGSRPCVEEQRSRR